MKLKGRNETIRRQSRLEDADQTALGRECSQNSTELIALKNNQHWDGHKITKLQPASTGSQQQGKGKCGIKTN